MKKKKVLELVKSKGKFTIQFCEIEKYKKLGELQDYSFDLSLNTKLSFEYSIELAEKLEIENTRILHNLSEIDSYFLD